MRIRTPVSSSPSQAASSFETAAMHRNSASPPPGTMPSATAAFGAQIFGDARPFAQFDNSGIGSGEQPEATRIDAQGGGHDFRIAAVIFGSCQSKAVVKSIHLVGVDGVNFEPALRHNLDDGTVRHFNNNVDLIWWQHGSRPATKQPSRPALRRLHCLLTLTVKGLTSGKVKMAQILLQPRR